MEGGVKMDTPLFNYTYRIMLRNGIPWDVVPEKVKSVANSLQAIGCVNVNVDCHLQVDNIPYELHQFLHTSQYAVQVWSVKTGTRDIGAVRGVIGRAFPKLEFVSEDIEPLTP